MEFFKNFRNAKKNHHHCHGGSTFVIVTSTPNLREEQLDQAWEILTQDFPMEMTIKRNASFDFCHPKFGGERVFSSPPKKKNQQQTPKKKSQVTF